MNSLRTSLNQVLRGKWLFLILGLIVAVTSSLQASVLFSDKFDGYAAGAAGSDFTAVYNLSAGSIVIDPSSGLGGSQSVQTTSATAVRMSPVINTGAGDINIELYFQWASPSSGAARPQIGLTSATTGVLNGTSDLSGRIGGNNTLEIRANGAGIGSDTLNMDTVLTSDNWYLFRLTISQTASSGVFSNTIAVFNSDDSGNVGDLVRAYTDSAVSNPGFYNQSTTYAAFRNTSPNPNLDNFSASQTPPPSATIAIKGTLGALSTIVGTASSSNAFTISGANLTGAPGNLIVTAPVGFEISRTNNSGYSTNNLSLPYRSGTLASTNVYVRLAAATAVGDYAGNIAVAGGGDSKAIATTASTVYPAGSIFLFSDDYTVSTESNFLDFENTLGRQAGSLFPLSYLPRYTGPDAFNQDLGNTTWIPVNTNALLFNNNGGARIDCDFSTNTGPLEIKWSVIFNYFGQPNVDSFTVGNSSDDYDPFNTAFAFQLHNDGSTRTIDHGSPSPGTSGAAFSDNLLVDYKIILSDTAGTGSAFGSGGSQVTYYQNGILLGTATFGQLTAGQGYLGFVGGNGYNGIDNLKITALPGSAGPNPTLITYTVTGGQLVLNWPSGQGWVLQAQTNNLTSGLDTNWSTISGATPPYTINVDPASHTVLYRLAY